MADLFELVGKIEIDQGGAGDVMDGLIKKATELAEKLGKFTIDLVTNAMENTDAIASFSKQFSMSTVETQELNYVLSKCGMGIDKFSGSMGTLNTKMYQAYNSTGNTATVFDKLGVAITDSNGHLRDQGDVLWDTLGALQQVENETERASLANEVFGSSGKELATVLNGENGSINDLRQQAHDLNAILGDDLVTAGENSAGMFDDLGYAMAVAGTKLGAALLPAVNTFLQILVDHSDEILAAVDDIATWIVDNTELIEGAMAVLVAAFAAGAAAAHPFAAAILAIVAGLALLKKEGQGLATGANYDKYFNKYSDEQLASLQAYIDAVNEAREADEAWRQSWGTENEGALAAKATAAEAKAQQLMGAVDNKLLADYQAWRTAQPENQGKDLYLDVPLRASEDSEGEIQGTVDGYNIEGLAALFADPSSEGNIQTFLDGLDLEAVVKLIADPSGLGDYANSGGADGSHANGLWRVPFDGYRAILHRDEAVLKASEAAVYRGEKEEQGSLSARRRNGGMEEQPMNVTLNITANSNNAYEIAGEVRNALELLRWQS